MPRRHPTVLSHLSAVAGVAWVLGVLAPQNAVKAETSLSVEATGGYTSNLLRQPDGSSDAPVSLGLTGTWIETTGRLLADVAGRVVGITYLEDTFDDEVNGQLDGSVTWWAVPERFAWVLDNVYGQVTTDPFSPTSPENRQNTNFLSTGPDWYIPLGVRTRAYLGGRYGSAWYEITDDNSDRLLGIVGIDRVLSSTSRVGLQASIETVEFDSALQPDFDRNEAYFHYDLTREPQLGLTINAGYTWLSGDAGDRSAPLLEMELSKELSPRASLTLELVSRFSDAGVDFAAGGLPGSGVGSDPGVIPEAGAFEERGGIGVIDLRPSRTLLSLAIGIFDELYDTATLDRRRYDARVIAERSMSQRMTGSARVLWSRTEYQADGLDREDTDTEYQLELRRELGPRTWVSIVGLYASRSSDDPLTEFDETRGYVAFNYSLR